MNHFAHEKDSNKFWVSRFFVLNSQQSERIASINSLSFFEIEQIPCLELDCQLQKKSFEIDDNILSGLAYIFSGPNNIRWDEEIKRSV